MNEKSAIPERTFMLQGQPLVEAASWLQALSLECMSPETKVTGVSFNKHVDQQATDGRGVRYTIEIFASEEVEGAPT